MKFATRFTVAVALFLLLAPLARAADPSLTNVLPRGGTRGTELELTLTGARLADAQEVLFYDAGVTVREFKAETPTTVKVKLAIAADARVGEHRLRLRTATGVSQLRTFFVGALPTVDEKEPNNDPAAAQKVELNVTVAGTMEREGLDHFAVEARQGQRITVEVEGMRLATTAFDPVVEILGDGGVELASRDDGALLLQDPVVSLIAPKDGRYVVRIYDSSYAGNDNTFYRLHVGTFPRPTAVYPAGGQAGQELSVHFLGDVVGAFSQSVKLPAEPQERFALLAGRDGQTAPSANAFRVSPFPNLLEVEPNHEYANATAAAGELPLALNGIIAERGDVDSFRFKARAGQSFHVQAYARRLRSPLDPVIAITDAAGKQIGANDDTGGPDAYLRFAAPADGEYVLSVTDQLKRGGADHVYRVEVTPVEPKLTLGLPFYDQNNSSQERQAIVVPKGNRFATLVRATRADFAGAVTLAADGLPDGVTMNAEPVPDGVDVVPVVFEASPSASPAGRLVSLTANPAKDDVKVAGVFAQAAVLVPNANDPPFYTVTVDRLAVAVAEEAPYKLILVQPKVPLVQGGSMGLKVVAERKPGFDAPIRLQMVFNPPGVSAGGVEIESGKTEVLIPLNADAGAAARKWKVCVLGSAEPEGGRVWASTQLADLEVAPPLLAMTMEMATVPRGQAGRVVVNVEHKASFDGRAKVKLVGLPPNATASPEELEFAAGDKTVTFDVKTTDKTPVGQHKSLLCVATVTKDGEPIVHNLARGGVLRVDAPPSAEQQAAAAAAKGKPAGPGAPADGKPAPAAAPLSRLEQLRREAAAKNAK